MSAAPQWGPINDQWLMTAIVRIPRDLWPTGLRLAETVDAVVGQYEAIRTAGGTPASPQSARRSGSLRAALDDIERLVAAGASAAEVEAVRSIAGLALEKANERLDAEVVMLRGRLARLLQAAEEMDDGRSEHNWAIVAAHSALEGTGR